MDIKKPKRHLVTAALPYANGPLHIGHIAGAYLPADTYVRYLRLKGEDVVFVCGSDEHGAAITIKAQKEGTTPQAIIDKYHGIIKKAFEGFGLSFDIYHRTSAPIHHETSQDFFKVLEQQGMFDKIASEQYYDETAGMFLADRYIVGTCPKCGHPEAYGDQCEKCGASLSPTDLKDPKSRISGNPPVLRQTVHWYLPLNKHEGWVKTWLDSGLLDGQPHHDPAEWKNHVLGQCRSWIDGGLQPRAMTRDLDWGVKVPLDEAEGKVLYVWLDAPIGYVSATKQWAKDNGKNWEDYWKSPDSRLVHFIGKDNIVFHCIIFPIILKNYGGFVLPQNVPANEFLNLEGDKLSTSRNWAVWLHEYLADFPGKQDVLRYVLTAISPENKDSEFTWKDFQARNNNELVATLGNFVNRAVQLTYKYFKGEVPVRGDLTAYDQEIADTVAGYPEKIGALIEKFRFKEAQSELMNLARLGDKYLATTKPWELYKHDPASVKTIINISLHIAANLAVLMQPFLPNAAAALLHLLGMEKAAWHDAGGMELLTPYDRLGPAALLFDKIQDEEIAAQLHKLERTKMERIPAEQVKEAVGFEQFAAMDIRTGTILEAEKVKGTKKLLKMKVDVGTDVRDIVSGIAEWHKPEDLPGKQVCVLANLAPREIKGIVSQGMILLAEDRNGALVFVRPDPAASNGSPVK